MNQNELNKKHIFHQIDAKSMNPTKRRASRRKRVVRVMAVIGSLLMVSGIIGSIICYLK